MNAPYTPDPVLEERLSRKLLDVFIRAGLAVALVLLCYRIFEPFLGLMAWSVILAVTLYPAHQKLARRMGGKQGLAATVLVVVGLVVIGVPAAILMGSLGDSLQNFVAGLRGGTAQGSGAGGRRRGLAAGRPQDPRASGPRPMPTCRHSCAAGSPRWPGSCARRLGMVAGIAGGALLFMFSFIIAGIVMAWGEPGARAIRNIFGRFFGSRRGDEFAMLCTQTIRAVALGVLGVAFIQATVLGIILVVASVPFAGVLALVVLLLGIVQGPAILVSLPVIIWIWSSGGYETGPAVTLHRPAADRGHTRQLPQAPAAGPRRRCADAGGPAGRPRRPGHRRPGGDVRRRRVPDRGLPGLHVVGGEQPGQRGGGAGTDDAGVSRAPCAHAALGNRRAGTGGGCAACRAARRATAGMPDGRTGFRASRHAARPGRLERRLPRPARRHGAWRARQADQRSGGATSTTRCSTA